MKLKLATALPSSVLDSLEDLIRPLYAKPGMRITGIVELTHVERIEVAPDEDKEPSVTVGLKLLEIAHGEQVDHLRRAAHALHVQRTARGTLDEELGELRLAKHIMEGLADDFALRETARLRAALVHQQETINRLRTAPMSELEMRKHLDKLYRTISAAVEWRDEDDDTGGQG